MPLGEESESYVLRVIDGGSLKREVVVTSAAWTYSAAMQAADSVTTPFEIEVAQVSQSFGPGPGARIVVGG